MKRKYPAKMFRISVLTNFIFHFFYLFIPGIILCIIGFWAKACLWIGLILLGLDLVFSIVEQIRLRQSIETPSGNPEYDEIMDALCGLGGFKSVKNIVDGIIEEQSSVYDDDDRNTSL